MSRVTPDEVLVNFETELDDEAIEGWISTATVLVDDIAAKDVTIDEERLTQIELALTRHFAHAQDPRVETDAVGDSQFTYQGETGLRIDATHYGQQAAMLDPTNTLTSNDVKRVGIETLDGRDTE